MINSLFNLYEKKLQNDNEAEILIALRDFFTSIIKEVEAFDPATGVSLSTDLENLLSAVNKFNSQTEKKCTKDFLYKISDYCLGAFEDLYKQMKEESIRTHQTMPVYRVRELDSSDMMALSRRPGRTIKEKLSGKPFMQAVKRNMSCNILENRLLKEFAFRIRELLETRGNAIHDYTDTACEELLYRADKFLHLEICDDILDWNNASPNNVLLQDKIYGKIWKAWKEINSIDDYIQYDSEHVDLFISLFLFWSILGKLSQYKNFHFLQQPIDLDYQNIQINTIYNIVGYSYEDRNRIISWTFKFLNNTFILSSSLNQKITVSIINQKVYVNQNEIGKGNLSFDDLITTFNFISDKIYKGELKELTKKTVINNLEDISFDLYSAKPYYAIDSKHYGQFEEKFLIQSWNLNETNYIVPLLNSSACYLSPNKDYIKTDSFISLLEENQEENDLNVKDISLISINLFQNIYSHFQCDRLRLVVPDSISDFALQPIRKNANAVFPKVYTIPRSIGAVFKFQASKDFTKANLKNGDFVFVLDRTQNTFSITPIQAEVYDKLNGKNIPSNIRWIKHPTITKKIDNNVFEYLEKQMVDSHDYWNSLNINNIQKDYKSFGLVNSERPDGIFIQTPDISNSLIQKIKNQTITRAYIAEAESKCKLNNTSKIYIIKASDWVYTDNDVNCNKNEYNPTLGSAILSEWQKQLPNILLWREHLPKLLMKVQLPKPINLCFNQEVEPVFGKRIKLNDIKIPLANGNFGELFGLKAGQPAYQFPLVIGDGATKVKYQAKLRSPVFPLKEDLDCRLEMYYTYGKDNPFELYFVPINNNSISSVAVEWTLYDPRNKPLVYPEFPPKLSVDELAHFKSLKQEGAFTSLFSWAKKPLNSLLHFLDNRCFATKINKNERIFFEDKNFGLITIENVNFSVSQIEKVFIHENAFEENDYGLSELEKAKKCGTISFYLKDSEKGYKASSIVAGYSLPHQYLQKIPGSLFFPLLTIFGNKQIEDFEDEWKAFFNSVIGELAAYVNFYNNKTYSEQTFDILFSLLCCFGNDSWCFTEPLIKSFYNKTKDYIEYRRHIAFALGTCSLQGQQEYFNKSIDYFTQDIAENISEDPFNSVSASSIYILSSSIWKNEDLLKFITPSQILVLYNGLEIFLEYTLSQRNQIRNQQRQIINAALELVLAILRFRKFSNEQINELMSPESQITKKMLKYIDKIDNLIKRTNTYAENKNKEYEQLYGEDRSKYKPEKFWPKTRLNFGDLPQKGDKDSLCYVLTAYLKEEELTSQIIIKGFSESE